MITEAEVDAAYGVVHSKLVEYIDKNVPFLFKGEVTSMLNSNSGKDALLEIVKSALEAAEKERKSG